jgi:hypothetical protein
MSKRRYLTQKKLLHLQSRMIKEAQCRLHPDPEGIASIYVIRLLEGLHKKSTVSQAYIDILRLESGRKGFKSYDARLNINRVASSEDQLSYMENQPEVLDISVDDRLDLHLALKFVKPKYKPVFDKVLLGYKYGEIALEMGVMESRVHQIVTREIERIKYKLDL